MYNKTHFRVKRNGKLNPVCLNYIVNQRGIIGGLTFRKYMTDLSEHLSKQFVIVVSRDFIMHILRVMISSYLPRLFHALQKFCFRNKIILNETKTKSVGFGMAGQFAVDYNGNV